MDVISRRLTAIERELRWTRVIGIALLTVALVLGAKSAENQSPPTADAVTAKRYILADENGNTRAVLRVDEVSHAASLAFRNGPENTLELVGGTETSPAFIRLLSRTARVEMRSGPTPEIFLINGEGSAQLGAGGNGAALSLLSEGTNHAYMGAFKPGARLTFDRCSPHGPCADRSAVELRLDEKKGAKVLFSDTAGKRVWGSP